MRLNARNAVWALVYAVLAGLNFGFVLMQRDFSSGFNLAVGLLAVAWAYGKFEHLWEEAP